MDNMAKNDVGRSTSNAWQNFGAGLVFAQKSTAFAIMPRSYQKDFHISYVCTFSYQVIVENRNF
jgi:hypothetical protein